jgi:S1-C subfamily serine protease
MAGMRRLIFLILFVLLTVAAIAWLTGIESPFAGARTHSVLTKDLRETNSGAKSEAKMPVSSLLLGSNVDQGRQGMNKAQAAATAVVPSLVSVEVSKGARWQGEAMARKLLGRLAADGVTAGSGGGGFLVDSHGLILTNFSTLLGGFSWTVHAADGRDYEASLVGVDAVTDLALIRIARDDTVPVRWSGTAPNFAENMLLMGFDPKDGPRVADVMVSSGMLEEALGGDMIAVKHFLVDYSPLDRKRGWLLLNLDGGTTGIVSNNVVMAAESVMPVIEMLQNSPTLHRIYSGIDSKELTPELANLAGARVDKGLLVTRVENDSPLRDAGLQAGDVVVGFGDVAVLSKAQFHRLLSGMAIGAKVPLIVQRGEQRLTLQVVLEEHKGGVQDLVRQWLELVVKYRKNTTTGAAR